VELKPGDRVRYAGPPLAGSGVPSMNLPDLVPGDEGLVVDVAPDGSVVVSWRDAPTGVHDAPSSSCFELLSPGGHESRT
jgi:hypothetical protein